MQRHVVAERGDHAGDLVFQIASLPVHGTVSLAGNVATYTPFGWWTGGPDSFTFTVTDNGNPAGSGTDALVSAPATVTVALPAYDIFWQRNDSVRNYADQSVLCQLRGPGKGVVYYSQTDPLLIERIILTGTTDATTFTVNVKSPVFYKVGDIEVRGSVRSINAPGLNLVGNVWVQGWTGSVNLRGNRETAAAGEASLPRPAGSAMVGTFR